MKILLEKTLNPDLSTSFRYEPVPEDSHAGVKNALVRLYPTDKTFTDNDVDAVFVGDVIVTNPDTGAELEYMEIHNAGHEVAARELDFQRALSVRAVEEAKKTDALLKEFETLQSIS